MANTPKYKIVHVFDGEKDYSIIPMVNALLLYSRIESYFIIVLKTKQKMEIYESLFREHKCIDYKIFVLSQEENSTFFIKLLVKCRMIKKDDIGVKLFSMLRQYSSIPFLFHGFPNSPLISLMIIFKLLKRVIYYCWAWRGELAKNFLQFMLHKLTYESFDYIFVTMEPDKKAITQNYKVNNIKVLAYGTQIPLKELELPTSREIDDNSKVILGNNSVSIVQYQETIQKMRSAMLKNKITVMLCYGMAESNPVFLNFQSFIREDENIDQWNNIVDLREYLNRLSQFDVYISPYEHQIGLLAIYYMFYCGKIVILRKANLEWCRSKGFFAFDLDKVDFKKFNQISLNKEQILQNHTIAENFFNAKEQVEKMDVAISEIIKCGEQYKCFC